MKTHRIRFRWLRSWVPMPNLHPDYKIRHAAPDRTICETTWNGITTTTWMRTLFRYRHLCVQYCVSEQKPAAG